MLWIVGGVILATAGTAVVTVARSWCPVAPIAMVQLLLPWWLVLTSAVAVVAAIEGTWVLVAVGALVVAGGITVMMPKLRRTPRRYDGVERPGSLTVVLANLYIDNDHPDDAIRQLLESSPDVLVMTELSTGLLEDFDRVGGADRYPNRSHPAPIQGEYAVGIFTALDIEHPDVWQKGELEVVEATVAVPGGGQLRVIAVHPEAPVGAASFRRWRGQLRELRSLLDDARGATIVIGDLNSGTLQPPYEQLLRSSFRDAHDLLGVALRPSWGIAPWLPRWVPTMLARLDHLLISPDVAVERLDDLDAVGSDHRPFRAELVTP